MRLLSTSRSFGDHKNYRRWHTEAQEQISYCKIKSKNQIYSIHSISFPGQKILDMYQFRTTEGLAVLERC